MGKSKCKIEDHIFSLNSDKKLACEKCDILYNPEYLDDVEVHKNAYRAKMHKPKPSN